MNQYTTMNDKGQVLIKKPVRDALRVSKNQRFFMSTSKDSSGTGIIMLKPVKSIMDFAGKFNPKKNGVKAINPLKVREYMEQNYERV